MGVIDLENDPNEMNNIYGESSEELITSLKSTLNDLKKEYKDEFTLDEMKLMTDTVIQRVYNEPSKLKTKIL